MKPKEKTTKWLLISILFITDYVNSEYFTDYGQGTFVAMTPKNYDAEPREDTIYYTSIGRWTLGDGYRFRSTNSHADKRFNSSRIRESRGNLHQYKILGRSRDSYIAKGTSARKTTEVYSQIPRNIDLTRSLNFDQHWGKMLIEPKNTGQRDSLVSVYSIDAKPSRSIPSRLSRRNVILRFRLTRIEIPESLSDMKKEGLHQTFRDSRDNRFANRDTEMKSVEDRRKSILREKNTRRIYQINNTSEKKSRQGTNIRATNGRIFQINNQIEKSGQDMIRETNTRENHRTNNLFENKSRQNLMLRERNSIKINQIKNPLEKISRPVEVLKERNTRGIYQRNNPLEKESRQNTMFNGINARGIYQRNNPLEKEFRQNTMHNGRNARGIYQRNNPLENESRQSMMLNGRNAMGIYQRNNQLEKESRQNTMFNRRNIMGIYHANNPLQKISRSVEMLKDRNAREIYQRNNQLEKESRQNMMLNGRNARGIYQRNNQLEKESRQNTMFNRRITRGIYQRNNPLEKESRQNTKLNGRITGGIYQRNNPLEKESRQNTKLNGRITREVYQINNPLEKEFRRNTILNGRNAMGIYHTNNRLEKKFQKTILQFSERHIPESDPRIGDIRETRTGKYKEKINFERKMTPSSKNVQRIREDRTDCQTREIIVQGLEITRKKNSRNAKEGIIHSNRMFMRTKIRLNEKNTRTEQNTEAMKYADEHYGNKENKSPAILRRTDSLEQTDRNYRKLGSERNFELQDRRENKMKLRERNSKDFVWKKNSEMQSFEEERIRLSKNNRRENYNIRSFEINRNAGRGRSKENIQKLRSINANIETPSFMREDKQLNVHTTLESRNQNMNSRKIKSVESPLNQRNVPGREISKILLRNTGTRETREKRIHVRRTTRNFDGTSENSREGSKILMERKMHQENRNREGMLSDRMMLLRTTNIRSLDAKQENRARNFQERSVEAIGNEIRFATQRNNRIREQNIQVRLVDDIRHDGILFIERNSRIVEKNNRVRSVSPLRLDNIFATKSLNEIRERYFQERSVGTIRQERILAIRRNNRIRERNFQARSVDDIRHDRILAMERNSRIREKNIQGRSVSAIRHDGFFSTERNNRIRERNVQGRSINAIRHDAILSTERNNRIRERNVQGRSINAIRNDAILSTERNNRIRERNVQGRSINAIKHDAILSTERNNRIRERNVQGRSINAIRHDVILSIERNNRIREQNFQGRSANDISHDRTLSIERNNRIRERNFQERSVEDIRHDRILTIEKNNGIRQKRSFRNQAMEERVRSARNDRSKQQREMIPNIHITLSDGTKQYRITLEERNKDLYRQKSIFKTSCLDNKGKRSTRNVDAVRNIGSDDSRSIETDDKGYMIRIERYSRTTHDENDSRRQVDNVRKRSIGIVEIRENIFSRSLRNIDKRSVRKIREITLTSQRKGKFQVLGRRSVDDGRMQSVINMEYYKIRENVDRSARMNENVSDIRRKQRMSIQERNGRGFRGKILDGISIIENRKTMTQKNADSRKIVENDFTRNVERKKIQNRQMRRITNERNRELQVNVRNMRVQSISSQRSIKSRKIAENDFIRNVERKTIRDRQFRSITNERNDEVLRANVRDMRVQFTISPRNIEFRKVDKISSRSNPNNEIRSIKDRRERNLERNLEKGLEERNGRGLRGKIRAIRIPIKEKRKTLFQRGLELRKMVEIVIRSIERKILQDRQAKSITKERNRESQRNIESRKMDKISRESTSNVEKGSIKSRRERSMILERNGRGFRGKIVDGQRQTTENTRSQLRQDVDSRMANKRIVLGLKNSNIIERELLLSRKENNMVSNQRNGRGFRGKIVDRQRQTTENTRAQLRKDADSRMANKRKVLGLKNSNIIERELLSSKKCSNMVSNQRNGRGFRGKIVKQSKELRVLKSFYLSKVTHDSRKDYIFTYSLASDRDLNNLHWSRKLAQISQRFREFKNTKRSFRSKAYSARNIRQISDGQIFTTSIQSLGRRFAQRILQAERKLSTSGLLTREAKRILNRTQQPTKSRETSNEQSNRIRSVLSLPPKLERRVIATRQTKTDLQSERRRDVRSYPSGNQADDRSETRQRSNHRILDRSRNLHLRTSFSSRLKGELPEHDIRQKLVQNLPSPLLSSDHTHLVMDSQRKARTTFTMDDFSKTSGYENGGARQKHFDNRENGLMQVYSALGTVSMPTGNIFQKHQASSDQIHVSLKDAASYQDHWNMSGRSITSFIANAMFGILIMAVLSEDKHLKPRPFQERLSDLLFLRS